MRKIEQLMVAAVRRSYESGVVGWKWKSGNTSVEVHAPGRVSVYLHGNPIALLGADDMSFTLAGWNTPTTRSRLNALFRAFAPGASVFQRNFKPFAVTKWIAREIDANEWITAKALSSAKEVA